MNQPIPALAARARLSPGAGFQSAGHQQAAAQRRFSVFFLCLFLMLAWRHGLSQSPWFQSRFGAPQVQEQSRGQTMGSASSEHAWLRLLSDAPRDAAMAPEQGAAPRLSAGPRLGAEQSRVVNFILEHYEAAADSVRDIVGATYAIAAEQNVDPLLILAMVAVESEFNPLAQSPRGAQGLMQILTTVHAARFEGLGGVAAVFDPVTNLRVGVGILKEYLSRNRTVEQALKIYVGAANLPTDRGYGERVMLARSHLEKAARSTSAKGEGATFD